MNPVLAFTVSQYGNFLATRSSAKAARESLETQIEAQAPDYTTLISFEGVDAMTISFADEFLGRFYSSLASGDVLTGGVLLTGFNEETREAVSICLERRDLVAAAIDAGELTLVGHADFMQETYQTALSLGTFRATELASALLITPQNANNRLKRLVGSGAVQRRRVSGSDRGGKEFVYTVTAYSP